MGREKGGSRWERAFALQSLQCDTCFPLHTGVVIFKELLASTRSITQAGDVDRLRSNFINGIKHMPVEVELA